MDNIIESDCLQRTQNDYGIRFHSYILGVLPQAFCSHNSLLLVSFDIPEQRRFHKN